MEEKDGAEYNTYCMDVLHTKLRAFQVPSFSFFLQATKTGNMVSVIDSEILDNAKGRL